MHQSFFSPALPPPLPLPHAPKVPRNKAAPAEQQLRSLRRREHERLRHSLAKKIPVARSPTTSQPGGVSFPLPVSPLRPLPAVQVVEAVLPTPGFFSAAISANPIRVPPPAIPISDRPAAANAFSASAAAE